MDPRIGALQAQLQQQTLVFQKLEAELAEIITARQRLDSQLSENELVLREFGFLKAHNTVYKLIGPSLVPQDQAEARGNVEKRLEYIKGEIKRVEAQLKDGEEKAGKKRGEIMALQQELQSRTAGSGGAGEAGTARSVAAS